jgi:hypothetical protein
MEGDVTIVVELAERHTQPVGRADLHDRVHRQVQELAFAQAGARAATNSLAAAPLSRKRGNVWSGIGKSPAKIGTRAGASSNPHGANLTGGALGFPPNLIAIARDWSADGFVHTLRTGKNPLGGAVGPQMPWQDFARAYSDEELGAIYAYVRSLN